MADYKMHLLVCGGTGCKASDSEQIRDNLLAEVDKHDLNDEVQVVMTGCFGFCEKGPIVKVLPDNTFYVQVKPEDAVTIVEEHVVKGRKVASLLYKDEHNMPISDSKHMEFYKKQVRIALRNCTCNLSERKDSTGGDQRDQTFRSARKRRRWLSNRAKMGDNLQIGGRPEICGLQCRRR